MTRWLRILFFALLLTPATAQAFRPVLEVCAEVQRDDCESEEGCDQVCPECPCCAAGAVTLKSPVISGVLDAPRAPNAPVRSVDPPVAPGTEILHVPKSA